MPETEDLTIETEDAAFACTVAGPANGPLALCLHGFPDTPRTWRYLRNDLVQAGWRVVCPFLRGFGSTRVNGVSSAGPAALGRDANAMHEALGADKRAVLIGHDWGAAAAYCASAAQPARWSKVVGVSWPPLPADIDLSSFEQMQRSWYVFLFQLPQATELVKDREFIRRLWALWSPGFEADEDAMAATDAIVLAGGDLAIEHYRQLFLSADVESGPLTLPTLYLHGARDGCIGSELLHGLEQNLPAGSKVQVLDAAGHFPQLEQPDTINKAVLRFLGDATV